MATTVDKFRVVIYYLAFLHLLLLALDLYETYEENRLLDWSVARSVIVAILGLVTGAMGSRSWRNTMAKISIFAVVLVMLGAGVEVVIFVSKEANAVPAIQFAADIALFCMDLYVFVQLNSDEQGMSSWWINNSVFTDKPARFMNAGLAVVAASSWAQIIAIELQSGGAGGAVRLFLQLSQNISLLWVGVAYIVYRATHDHHFKLQEAGNARLLAVLLLLVNTIVFIVTLLASGEKFVENAYPMVAQLFACSVGIWLIPIEDIIALENQGLIESVA